MPLTDSRYSGCQTEFNRREVIIHIEEVVGCQTCPPGIGITEPGEQVPILIQIQLKSAAPAGIRAGDGRIFREGEVSEKQIGTFQAADVKKIGLVDLSDPDGECIIRECPLPPQLHQRHILGVEIIGRLPQGTDAVAEVRGARRRQNAATVFDIESKKTNALLGGSRR